MDNCEVVLRLVQKEAEHAFLIAIDGRCAAGKTTLAEKIQSSMECNVIHMDDFYLPFSERTEEKMARPGGNMDFERLLFEVLLPLRSEANAMYRPYDCHHDTFLPSKELNAGVSIGRPDLRFHDLRHSYAVAAIRSGDDIKTVQGNLGHATAAFTLDVYGHVTDQMKLDSAARMEKFIEKVSGS